MKMATSTFTYAAFISAILAPLLHGLVVDHSKSPSSEPQKYLFAKIHSENGVETYIVTGTPDTGNANDYMDEVFHDLTEYMNETGLGTHPLPDRALQFKKKILGITFSGKFGLEKGFIRGLNTIHRTGDCTITTDGDEMYVDAVAGLVQPTIGYSGTLQFMGKGLTLSVSGTVDQTSARSHLVVKELQNVTLSSFHITEIGHIKVGFSGLGPLNFLVEMLGDFVVAILKSDIPWVCDGPIEREMQKVIDQIPISHLIPSL